MLTMLTCFVVLFHGLKLQEQDGSYAAVSVVRLGLCYNLKEFQNFRFLLRTLKKEKAYEDKCKLPRSLMHSNWSRYDKHLKLPWLGTPAWHVESRWQEARVISATSSYTNTRNSIFWWQQCVRNVFQCVAMYWNNLWVYKAWVQEIAIRVHLKWCGR